MKKYMLSFSVLLSVFGSVMAQELNVMSFNIRFNNPRDSANAWPHRKHFAGSQVLFHKVSVLGVQEALEGQILDMLQLLPAYRYIGVGRDDGKSKGEYSAILYDTTRLRPLDHATFWLSETPEVPGSKSWDAAITRIVTWAKFRDLKTRKEFYLFNTHFDHIGKVARRSSAHLLLKKVKEIAGNKPAIITGDFNAHPSDEPIQVITDSANPLHLTDSKAVSQQPHYGPGGTFNGFQPKETSEEPIDYIFLKGKFDVLQHATISQSWMGRFSSDHFPVWASIVIK